MKIELRQLNENDEKAFLQGINDWEGEDLTWYSFLWRDGMTYLDMLDLLKKEHQGIDLPEGRVPATMLYGFLDGQIVGRVNIRHELNDQLRRHGGHIGYSVAPRFRDKGYAKEMLSQSLDFCKKLGLPSVMLTCADDNIPSWKVIEALGGKLQDRFWDVDEERTTRRYWIDL